MKFMMMLVLYGFLTFQVHAQNVILDKSQITFVSKQMNVPVEGKFKKFNAQINFDSSKLDLSRATIELELNSVDTGSQEADTEVKTKAWFDSTTYPQAKFVSSGVKALGGGKYEAAGKLSIKGKTRDVKAQFVSKADGAGTWLEGSFVLNRLQFNIGEGTWSDTSTVADEIQVKFKFLISAAAKK